jgi:hypothetical protein|tara:strand:- start:47 stop:148 length:102 start_codon:yes stop_codon:yes gene_type:complete
MMNEYPDGYGLEGMPGGVPNGEYELKVKKHKTM